MRKSTRILFGMLALDMAIMVAAGWMVMQTRSGAWHAPDPAEATARIADVAGAAIGVVTAVMLVAFFQRRKRGD